MINLCFDIINIIFLYYYELFFDKKTCLKVFKAKLNKNVSKCLFYIISIFILALCLQI